MVKKSWKNVENYSGARVLLASCAPINWLYIYNIRKNFTDKEIVRIIFNLFASLKDHKDEKSSSVIITENLLALCAFYKEEYLLDNLIEKITANSVNVKLGLRFIEIGFSINRFHNQTHADKIRTILIIIACRLGITIQDKCHSRNRKEARKNICKINSYLSTDINNNDYLVQLVLIYYGSYQVSTDSVRHLEFFNKAFDRYGCFMIEHLLYLFYIKATRRASFQYLIQIIPSVMSYGGKKENKALKIIFQHFVLKDTVKFMLFWKEVTKSMTQSRSKIINSYVEHFEALMEYSYFMENKCAIRELADMSNSIFNSRLKNTVIARLKQNQNIDEQTKLLFIHMIDGKFDHNIKTVGRKIEISEQEGISWFKEIMLLERVLKKLRPSSIRGQ